jgi:hypothetical protein
MALPNRIEQIALFVFGGGRTRLEVSGGRVVFIRDFMAEIHAGIKNRGLNEMIPERFPNLRTLHFAARFWNGDNL